MMAAVPNDKNKANSIQKLLSLLLFRQYRLTRLSILGIICYLYTFRSINRAFQFKPNTDDAFLMYYLSNKTFLKQRGKHLVGSQSLNNNVDVTARRYHVVSQRNDDENADTTIISSSNISVDGLIDIQVVGTTVEDEPLDSNFYNIRFNSGEFGQPQTENDRLIERVCRTSTLNNYKTDPCFASNTIESNTTCCFCYDRYPYFVLEDPKWSSHATKFGAPPDTPIPNPPNTVLYWFCAEPRINTMDTKWERFEKLKDKIFVLTGKFGHKNPFQGHVDSTCNGIKGMDRVNASNVFCYSEFPSYILEDARFLRHMRYLINPKDDSARGGGYWFFKSVLLRHHMETMEDDAYIIWVDADHFMFFEHGHFEVVMVTMEDRNADFTIEELPGYWSEKQFSKEDVLHAFNATELTRNSGQINGNAMVIRNSPKMRRFVDAWVDCVSNWHMVSDEPSILPNRPDFIENRHDQTLISLLVRTFLTNQSMLGPPVRSYHQVGAVHTYQLEDKNVDSVNCPF